MNVVILLCLLVLYGLCNYCFFGKEVGLFVVIGDVLLGYKGGNVVMVKGFIGVNCIDCIGLVKIGKWGNIYNVGFIG